MKSCMVMLAAASLTVGSFSASAQAQENILVEEYTGAWCGACPEGQIEMERLREEYPDLILVSTHVEDAMEIPTVRANAPTVVREFPSIMINRTFFEGEARVGVANFPNVWRQKLAEYRQGEEERTPPSVAVESLTYDPESRQLEVTMSALFHETATGDLNLNLFVVEDSVTGTGEGYDQTNYFDDVAGHKYQGKGKYIKGYIHRHVLRAMAGGYWGTPDIVPTDVEAGTEVVHTFSVTLQEGWNPSRISVVALVQRSSSDVHSREILNAVEEPVPYSGSVSGVAERSGSVDAELRIQPTIVRDRVELFTGVPHSNGVRLEVFDGMGNRVAVIASGQQLSGNSRFTWDCRDRQGQRVADGAYLVRLTTARGAIVEKVVVMR